MKKSAFLQTVGDGDYKLYYHSLLGNLYMLEKEYMNVLESDDPTLSAKDNPQIIEELKSAFFLVEDSCDERQILSERNEEFLKKVAGGKTITSLDLNVSEVCNFACPHCMNRSGLVDNKHAKMPWDIAKKAIDLYMNHVTNLGINGYIHFGSAEPLTNWKVVKKCITYCRENFSDVTLAMNTNLSLLNEDIAKFLRDNKVFIATSLDGPRNGNDLIRMKVNGGTYDIIMNKISLLSKVGYPLDGISITMNDLNIDYIDDAFITSLKELGFTGIATDIDLVNSKNCNRDVDFYVDKLMSIYLTCEKLGIDNFGSWSSVYSNLVNQENEDPITYCKAQCGQNISVNPEGNVFLCGYSSSSIGSIDHFDELFIENNPFYNLINSRLPGKDPKCKGCKLEGICSGQCLVTNEFNESKKIDFMCKFFIKTTTRLLEHKLEKEKKLIN